jgi:hypothetical protein
MKEETQITYTKTNKNQPHMTNETRQNVIDTIIDLAGDEFETPADYIQLARETPEELVNRLIGIACYYRDEYNN